MSQAHYRSEESEEQSHVLPGGWTSIRLGEIAESITYGYTASAAVGSTGPRFLRITDIQNGGVDWNSVPTCKIGKSDADKYELHVGDIVFARTGATTGKSFLIRSCPPAVFASYLIRLRLCSHLNPAFLALFFQTPEYWQFISENVAGNAQPNCNASKLAALKVPIPPLPEQLRLVATVERLLSDVNSARDRVARVPAILKRFRHTVLSAACSGRLTAEWREAQKHIEPVETLYERIQTLRAERHSKETATAIQEGRRKPTDPRNSERANKPVIELPELPSEWGLHTLQDLSYLITDGTHKTPSYRETGVAFLSVKNVRPFKILDGDVKRISQEEHREINGRCNPEVGDILYTKVGTFGYAAVNRLSYPFSLFVSVSLIKPVQECFTPEYAEIVMNSDFVYAQAVDRVSGSGVPDLHLLEIRDFRIPLPSVAEQDEIVRRVKILFQLADAVELRLGATVRRVDELTQSILAKAFRGELVPTEAELAQREGREYEPASALLERIRSTRPTVP